VRRVHDNPAINVDRREAVRRFIRDNSKLLFADPFPSELFKKTKRIFFLERAKVPPPRDAEIASELLEMMIASSQVANHEQLEKTLGFPFIRDNVINKQYFREKMDIKEAPVSFSLDLEKLNQTEELEKVLENLRAEATLRAEENASERLKELRGLIAQYEAQLAEFRGPSILERAEYSFPQEATVDLKEDRPEEGIKWWEKLDLKDDPFPDLTAETTLPMFREYYDAITCKTKVFKDYQSIINDPGEEIFRNSIFHGQYGSGKTHLFRYLEQILILGGYETVYILFSFEDDLRSIVTAFRKQLYEQLAQRYQQKSNEVVASDPQDIEEATEDLLRGFTRKYRTKGIIIFLDDLHKGNLEAALEFINRLQPFTGKLRLIFSHIAFFIAGHPDMEKMMENNPKYSGSLTRAEHMPNIDVDIACMAFEKRLRAYAKNSENPKQVDRRAMERIFAGLKIVTFRQVIDDVIKTFKKGDFKALTVDPVRIPSSTLASIKSAMERNQRLKYHLDRLTYGRISGHSPTPEQKTECLDKLCAVYNRREFPDAEIGGAEAAYFQALWRAGLIDSRPTRDGTVWYVTAPFARMTKVIYSQFGLSPDQYLKRIYGIEKERVRDRRNKNPELALIESFTSLLPHGAVRNLVETARNLHEKILARNESYLFGEQVVEVLALCSKSLASVTRAYLSHERLPFNEGQSDDSQIQFWKDFWNDDIATLTQEYLSLKGESDNRSALLHAINLYGQAFSLEFSFLKKQYESSSRIPIPLADLKNDEIKVLNDCRDLWSEGDYPSAARKLNVLVEKKIRSFLFDTFTWLYGVRENRLKWVDQQSKDYISKGLEGERQRGLTTTANEFNFLNRGQYKLVMTGADGNSEMGSRNWKNIFADVFYPWSEKDLFSYLDGFAEYNLASSHNVFERFGADQPTAVFEAIIKSEKFMSSINRSYLRMLDSTHFEVDESAREGRFSLAKFADRTTSQPIPINQEDLDGLSKTYKDRQFRVNLDDQTYVQNVFGLGYRESYALIAVMKQNGGQGWADSLKLTIVWSRGPEVKFQLRPKGQNQA
jgi:hypothetical protein